MAVTEQERQASLALAITTLHPELLGAAIAQDVSTGVTQIVEAWLEMFEVSLISGVLHFLSDQELPGDCYLACSVEPVYLYLDEVEQRLGTDNPMLWALVTALDELSCKTSIVTPARGMSIGSNMFWLGEEDEVNFQGALEDLDEDAWSDDGPGCTPDSYKESFGDPRYTQRDKRTSPTLVELKELRCSHQDAWCRELASHLVVLHESMADMNVRLMGEGVFPTQPMGLVRVNDDDQLGHVIDYHVDMNQQGSETQDVEICLPVDSSAQLLTAVQSFEVGFRRIAAFTALAYFLQDDSDEH